MRVGPEPWAVTPRRPQEFDHAHERPVVAVDAAGNRSAPSNAVTLTIVADENLR